MVKREVAGKGKWGGGWGGGGYSAKKKKRDGWRDGGGEWGVWDGSLVHFHEQ